MIPIYNRAIFEKREDWSYPKTLQSFAFSARRLWRWADQFAGICFQALVRRHDNVAHTVRAWRWSLLEPWRFLSPLLGFMLAQISGHRFVSSIRRPHFDSLTMAFFALFSKITWNEIMEKLSYCLWRVSSRRRKRLIVPHRARSLALFLINALFHAHRMEKNFLWISRDLSYS